MKGDIAIMLERLTTGLIIIILYVLIISYLVRSLWNPEILFSGGEDIVIY